ncbi:MAG: hypothetical protein AAGA15_10795 [Pseudomonadota bacterium]
MTTRQTVSIDIFAGTFESQPLAFAHLYDLAKALDVEIALDAVEVICKADPVKRLTHYFDAPRVNAIIDEMGLNTSLILIFPEAMTGALEGSTLLIPLGRFDGTRPRP